LAPRIAELKEKFVEKVLTQEVQSWDRDQFKARVRDAVKSWEGVVLFASGLAKHSLDQYDPKNQFTVEPPSAAGFRYDELKEMAGLPVSVDDLRNDPRSAGGSLVGEPPTTSGTRAVGLTGTGWSRARPIPRG